MSVTDLIPVNDSALEWAWVSPSTYWQITKVQPAARVGRQAGQRFSYLQIEFTHMKSDGDRIIVEAFVQERDELLRLKAFLDAAVDLPVGVRIRAHTMEKAPWDHVTPRHSKLRFSSEKAIDGRSKEGL
jgi:hypothetical protein